MLNVHFCLFLLYFKGYIVPHVSIYVPSFSDTIMCFTCVLLLAPDVLHLCVQLSPLLLVYLSQCASCLSDSHYVPSSSVQWIPCLLF